MTGTAAAAAGGPQAQLEDGRRALFCRARNDGAAGRGKKCAPAVAAQGAEAKPVSVIKPVARGRDGQGVAQVAKENGWPTGPASK